MSYRIEINVPIDQSILRILQEEIDKTIGHIESIPENPKAVHSARKSLKRASAAMVLAIPMFRGKAAKSVQKRVRGIAKTLGSTRDSQVVVDAVTSIEKDFASAAHARLFSDVRSWLQARRDRTSAKIDPVQIKASLDELEELKAAIQALKVRHESVDVVLAAAQATYAQARMAMSNALETEDEAALHRWRKLVQRHWRHMSLFSDAWAQESKARIALAHDLSETLGAHHDLAILRSTIQGNRAVFSDASDIEVLFASIDKKQRILVSRAAVQGERLFAEKPKAFLRRFGIYWHTARHAQDNREAQTLAA